MPASFTRAQKGSKSRSPSERRFAPGTGAARRSTTRASRASTHSSSATACLHVHQREHGRREDALAPREAPILVEPLVEGVQRRVGQVGVVAQRVLDADAERREQQAALDPLLVHQREPRFAVAVGRADRLELAEGGADVEALGVVAAEEAVEAAGLRDRDRRSDSG